MMITLRKLPLAVADCKPIVEEAFIKLTRSAT